VATIKNLLIRIGISDKNVTTGVARVNKALDKMADKVDRLEKLGRVGNLAALAGSVIQLGRAFAPATAALGQFAVAAAPAWGAILTLPAILAMAGAAMATFKVGISGVGAALKAVASGDAKKADAALKKLAPSARAFVTTMAQAKNSFDPVRRAVQQRLFEGLSSQIRTLALRNLPILRTGMVAVAGSLNGIGRQALSAANTPLFSGMIAKVMASTARVLKAFQPAVRPLITALARLVVIGLPLAEAFGTWAAHGLKIAASFLASERAARKMTDVVERAEGVFWKEGDAAGAAHVAMQKLRVIWGQLTTIGKNVFSVVKSIGTAMSNSTAPSKSLLDLITQLTARLAAWAKSAEGQKQLSQLFSSLQQVASNLMEILPQLGGVLTLILTVINGMPGPVRNVVLQMLAWSIVLSRFSGPIGGAIKLLGGLGKAMKVINTGGVAVGKGAAALGKGIGSLGAATGRTAGTLGAAAGNAARTMASVAASMGRATGSALLSLGRMTAATVATAARVVAGWVLMGVQSLIQAARMAAAWFIALGPIGWITAAVIAIVALIILKWSTVKKWTVAIWHAVWDFIKMCARGIVTAVGWLAGIPGKVAGYFSSMASRAVSAGGRLLRYVRGIPRAIMNVFSGAGRWLLNAGRAIIDGLVNGLKAAVGWLKSNLSWITSLIPSWKGPMDVDLRLLEPSGAAIMTGLVSGITRSLPRLHRALSGVTDSVRVGVAMPVSPRSVAASLGTGTTAQAASRGGPSVRIWFDWGTGNNELKTLMKKIVRVDGGGDVAVAFGGNR
jgi:hypothetical protein